ncbi:MAG: cytidylyltransferase domain-containing protein [Candidatus Odinarchaeota archaeon]
MKNIVCIIARTYSKRLPNKVLKEINGTKLIEYIIKKVKRSKLVNNIYLCTSIDKEDRILLKIAKEHNIKPYAGHRIYVINRMLEVAEKEKADNVIRITGDNIFTDEVYIDLMLKYHDENGVDYTRTEFLPLGVTAEVIRTNALKNCYNLMDPSFSQYLLLYMFQPEKFNCLVLIPENNHKHPDWSLTVDTQEDIIRSLKIINKRKYLLNYEDIVSICTTEDIPYLYFKTGTSVKFPAGLIMTYGAFKEEMKKRIKKAKTIQLAKGEYLEMVNEQKL